DITTTAFVVGLGIISMFVYAIYKTFLTNLYFITDLVADGEVWRLVTWPVVNPPTSIWSVLTLLFFWWFATPVEEEIGRKPFTVLYLVMTVVPALLVTVISGLIGDPLTWTAAASGLELPSIAFLCIYALEHPNAQTFFLRIPFWIIAAVIVGIQV